MGDRGEVAGPFDVTKTRGHHRPLGEPGGAEEEIVKPGYERLGLGKEAIGGDQVAPKPQDVCADPEPHCQPVRVAVVAGDGNRPPDGAFGLGQVAELSQTPGEVDQDVAQVVGVADRLEGGGRLSTAPHRLLERPAEVDLAKDANGPGGAVGVAPASKRLEALLGEASGHSGVAAIDGEEGGVELSPRRLFDRTGPL